MKSGAIVDNKNEAKRSNWVGKRKHVKTVMEETQ